MTVIEQDRLERLLGKLLKLDSLADMEPSDRAEYERLQELQEEEEERRFYRRNGQTLSEFL